MKTQTYHRHIYACSPLRLLVGDIISFNYYNAKQFYFLNFKIIVIFHGSLVPKCQHICVMIEL